MDAENVQMKHLGLVPVLSVKGASRLTNLWLQMVVAGTQRLVAERLGPCQRMVAVAVLLKALIPNCHKRMI
jgi:hypothetical protein